MERAVALSVFVVLTVGCAALERIKAEAVETSRPFPAPPEALDAPQDSRAILVLDIDLTQGLSEVHLVGVELERGDGAPIRAGVFDEFHLFEFSATERGLVLFSSLVPTRYHVAKVKGSVQVQQTTSEFIVYPPEADSMAMELEAGEVRYLHLAGHQRLFSGQFEWQTVTGPSRAHEALEWVAQRYPGSSWTEKIRAEILTH